MKLFKDIKNLLIGMKITGKHLGRHAITIQYPEQRAVIPARSRGIVVLLSDQETGELNCTGCLLCEKACPTAAIRIDAPRDENKRKVLKSFVLDNALCCFCGLCVEACNFSAMEFSTEYEFSTLTINELIWDINKLQEVGRKVKYEDTRKKKNPARIVGPDWEPPPPPPAAEETPKTVETKPANPNPDSPVNKDEKNNDAAGKEE